jgi:hypothetical protein
MRLGGWTQAGLDGEVTIFNLWLLIPKATLVLFCFVLWVIPKANSCFVLFCFVCTREEDLLTSSTQLVLPSSLTSSRLSQGGVSEPGRISHRTTAVPLPGHLLGYQGKGHCV